LRLFFTFGFFILSLASCTTYKQLQVLQGDIDTSRYSQIKVPEQKVQKGDQLSITVFSDNAAASAIFNGGAAGNVVLPQAPMSASSGNVSGNVYEVDHEGMIYFPQLGKIKIEGLTREGIITLLNASLKDRYLTNPYYAIQFLNLKITVFGDVNKPGVYTLSRPNTNIFEALTFAGDLTYYGKRENVMVIREVDGKRVFGRIDITSTDVFNSPYYYLQQNDMVFVDMRKGKVNSTDQAWLRNASLLLSLLTTVTILVNIIR
jgi:polysaccharide export outer membrane protein